MRAGSIRARRKFDPPRSPSVDRGQTRRTLHKKALETEPYSFIDPSKPELPSAKCRFVRDRQQTRNAAGEGGVPSGALGFASCPIPAYVGAEDWEDGLNS